MAVNSERATAPEYGLTAVVAAIIANLDEDRVEAPSGAWHWAFKKLRDEHASRWPQLKLDELEFSQAPGVWPISESLERIFQFIDMAGFSSNLNWKLRVRQFDLGKRDQLKQRFEPILGDENKERIVELSRALTKLLSAVPERPA